MSTSQRAVMPYSWGVKAGIVRVWVAGKTVWSPCYTWAISERFRDKEIIKRYINSSSLLYFFLHKPRFVDVDLPGIISLLVDNWWPLGKPGVIVTATPLSVIFCQVRVDHIASSYILWNHSQSFSSCQSVTFLISQSHLTDSGVYPLDGIQSICLHHRWNELHIHVQIKAHKWKACTKLTKFRRT